MASLNHSSSNKDGIFNFINTLGKKKKAKELEELEVEGKSAMDHLATNPAIDTLPEDYILGEFEERRMIHPSMNGDNGYQSLKHILINWINDELSEYRMIVFDLEDLYDGAVVVKLVEKLAKIKLDLVEVTLNEELQKSNLKEVLGVVHGLLDGAVYEKWTVDGIHGKDLVQIIQLLVALVRHFRVPIRLPENVNVKMVVIQKLNGLLVPRIESVPLTGRYDDLGVLSSVRDEFDAMYDGSPEFLRDLHYHLILFLNEQLVKLNIECQVKNGVEIDEEQFSDGLLLIFLMGLCENFFVPLGNIFITPNSAPLNPDEEPAANGTLINSSNYVNSSSYHKLHNMNVAFQLMEDANLPVRKISMMHCASVREKIRPEEIINCDKKSLLRLLYLIYRKYSSGADL